MSVVRIIKSESDADFDNGHRHPATGDGQLTAEMGLTFSGEGVIKKPIELGESYE